MSDNGSNTGRFGIPPGGPWFVFPVTGTKKHETNKIAQYALSGSGWLGFPTEAAADTFAQKSLASKAESAISSTTGYVAKFVDAITNPKLWLRVVEVVAGLILVGIGLARLTGKTNEIKQLAATGAKAAAL